MSIPRGIGRVVAIAAIGLFAGAFGLLVMGGGGGYRVTAEFENASQVVGGERVVIGGAPVGTVTDVGLGDRNQAEISFSIDDAHAPLPEGTTATVRNVSIAGIANRRIELDLPEEGKGTIEDGATIPGAQTVSAVDVDELINALNPRTVRDLKRTVKGFAAAYRGAGRRANRGYRYLNPLLSTSRRVIGELTRDRRRFGQLIVDTSRFSTALAAHAPELSALVRNLNLATGAIGRQRAALADAVGQLPGVMRLSNTAFVNLRAAADDLDPLLVASRPVAERLQPFFAQLRAVAAGSVPTLRGLDAIVRRRGKANDLTDVLRAAVPMEAIANGSGTPGCGAAPGSGYLGAADGDFAQGALGETTCALSNSLPILGHMRAYTPELIGWFDDFGTSGALDASGGVARIAGTFNAFTASPANGLPELLAPIDPADLFGTNGSGPLIDLGNTRRCPGANERDPGDGSVPFTDGGQLNCDPSQVATGP